jgi:hypothetical protein
MSCVNQPGARYPEIDPEAWALRDFRDAIYYPVRAVRDGVSPYHVRLYVESYPVGQDFPPYSPLTLLVHWPFGLTTLPIAEWTYFGLTVALSLVLAWYTLRVCGLRGSLAAVFTLAAAVCASRPGHMNLLLGQTTIPLVLFSLGALHFAALRRPWLSGLCIALATLKPTYGVILIPLMFAMGHRNAAVRGFVLTAAITLPLVLWMVWMQGGWQDSLEIARENGHALYDNPGRDPAQSFSRIDALALWARWLPVAHASKFELLTTSVMLATGCVILFLSNKNGEPTGGLSPSGIFALLVLLLSVYHHAYDAILLIPIVLAAICHRGEFWRHWSQLSLWAWCGLAAIPLVNYAATNSLIDKFRLTGIAWTLVTSVNGAALLIATVWLGIALLNKRAVRFDSVSR